MKKALFAAAAMVVCAGMGTFSFAETVSKAAPAKKEAPAMEVIRGEVVSVDQAAGTIMVKEDKTGAEKAFTVSKEEAAALKAGEQVKLKMKAGSTAVESVKVITAMKHKDKK